jgi:hypothetical protein
MGTGIGGLDAGMDLIMDIIFIMSIMRYVFLQPTPQPLSQRKRGDATPFSLWEKVPRRGG